MALDATTGSERWRYSAPAAGGFHPAAFADGVVYAGSDSGGFVSVDAATGALRWHADIGTDTTGSTAVVADGTVFVADVLDSATGHLSAFDAANGNLRWRLDEPIPSPAVSGGVAYSVSQGGIVSAHNAATGKELWRFQAKGPLGPAGVAAGVVYVPAKVEQRIYALDAGTGAELWRFDLDGLAGSLAVTHGSLYAGTSVGSVYALGSITTPVKFLWQAKGDGDGLDFPGALALAPDGRIWVADTGHDRFAIFKPDGTFVEYWGSAGNGDGQFAFRRANGDGYGALAFAPDGSFYVLDVGNRRVQHFDKERHFLKAWGSFGNKAGQYVDPIAIVVDAKGSVHVLDDARGVIETYDKDGHVLSSFDPHLAGVNSANSMTLDAKGNTYVTACCSAGNKVQKYDESGKLVATIGSPGTGPGQFNDQPGGIGVDAAGRVFVIQGPSGEGDRILVFDAGSRFLTSFGSQGSGDGQFGFGTSLVLDRHGDVYAGDAGSNRLEKFKLLPPLSTN